MNYLQSTKEVTTWRRSHHVEFYNPLPGQGGTGVAFDEQDCVDLGDRVLTTAAAIGTSRLQVSFEPGATFDIYDPVTGEKTGQTATHEQIYALMYSLYITAAKARDEAAAPPPAPAPAPAPEDGEGT